MIRCFFFSLCVHLFICCVVWCVGWKCEISLRLICNRAFGIIGQRDDATDAYAYGDDDDDDGCDGGTGY